MKPRPVRSLVRSEKPRSRTVSLKKIFVSFVGLILIGATAYWLWSKPPLICRTQEFTRCTEQELSVLQENTPRRWRLLIGQEQIVLGPFHSTFPEWSSVESQLLVNGAWQVIIERGYPVARIRVENQAFELLSNGFRRSTELEPWPVIAFETHSTWEAWQAEYVSASESAQALDNLTKNIPILPARPTEIMVKNSTEVTMRLENTVRATLSIKDPETIGEQLRTLQAVVNTSTMDQLPSEVDVRFKNVIIRN